MADVKISELPAATTPLAGTEQIPLVQSNTTKKVTVNGLIQDADLGTPTAVDLTNATNVPMAEADGILAVANGGTGTATPSIVAGSNVAVSGTWPNQTVAVSGIVTGVTATAPVVSSGGTAPVISMAAATGSVNGYLTSTDWTTFNSKQPAGSYLTDGGALGTPSSGTATNLTGLPLTTGVTGVLPIANGGTNASTAANARGNILPSYSGNAGKVLAVNSTATDVEYISASGSGTVTSVDVSGGTTGLTTSGGPVTAAGTITLAGTLAVANGGTGTSTPSLVAGTNVTITGTWPNQTINSSGGGSMTYPGAGIANSTGSAWGTSYSTTGSGTVVALATSPTFVTPVLGTPTSGDFSTGTFTWPTFNQNTSGTAAGLSATLAVSSGGTGQTTAAAAITALTGTQTSGYYLRSDGTNAALGAIQAADVPTLNQNTTGSAGSVANALTAGTGISFSSGTTYNGSAAITINNSGVAAYPGAGIPNSTGSAWGTSYSTSGTGTVLALTTSPTFVTPALGTPASGDFSTGTFTWPTFNQNTSGTAAGLSATLAVSSGGTGQTSYTDGQLLIGNSTGNTLTKATLTAGANITITNSAGGITIAASGGGGGSAATPTALGTVYGATSSGSPYLTALGYAAGGSNTGASNVAIGYQAGTNTTSGAYNVSVGQGALQTNTTGNNNVAIGRNANSASSTASDNISIGFNALVNSTSGANNVGIGSYALAANTTAYFQTAIGYQALYNANKTANVYGYSTAVGYQAGKSTTTGNVTAIGSNALLNNTTGTENVAVGGETDAANAALKSNTTGSYNTAMGVYALQANTTANGNSAFGYAALGANTGASNSAFGFGALQNNTSSANNVSIGYQSLYSVTSASGNHVAVGYQALYSATDNSNVAMGYRAGYAVTSGHNNVLIGTNAGYTGVALAGGAQNVVIGADARTNTTGAYNEIVIGQTCNGVGNDYVTIGKLNNRVYNHYDTNATWTQSSDVRLKTDIQDDSLGLSFINKLRPVKYRWKATNELELDNPHYNEVNNKNTTAVMHGLIAQEVKAALDEEGVSTFGGWDIEPNGIQGISREMFITPLINAVQELTAQVEALKAEVAALKGNV